MMTMDRERVETFVYKYWVALENWRYDEALAMLTDDVEYVTMVTSHGKTEVAAAFQKRGTALLVRHLITNMIIERTDASIEIAYLLTAFGKVVAEGEAPPYPAAVPENIADVDMTLVEVDGDLKIKRLNGKPVFRARH